MFGLKTLAFLFIVVVAGAVWWRFTCEASKVVEEQTKSWELSVTQLYGKQITDFVSLGDDGLYFEWLTPSTSELTCIRSKHCNIIRLANVLSCEHGFKVYFDYLNDKDQLLSKGISSTTFVPAGKFAILEIDTEALPSNGSVYLSGAECQTHFSSE